MSDPGVAIKEGVKAAQSDPNCFFIDDKFPAHCSLGIPSLASVLKRNLPSKAVSSMLITLCLSICRVVLAVAWWRHSGLKLAFGDPVHCFYGTNALPCYIVHIASGLHNQIFCSGYWYRQPYRSGWPCHWSRIRFVGRAMERLLDGLYSLSDQTMTCLAGWRGRRYSS